MSRRPIPKSDPDSITFVQVRLNGALKNEVVKHCDERGYSLNAWLVEIVKYGLRMQKGIPEPPQAFAPLPTPAEEIRAWAEGRKILTPCGKQGECYGTQNEPEFHDGYGFCKECSIRVV